jgi:hypothetical protein
LSGHGNDAEASEKVQRIPGEFYQQKLKDALRAGVEALNDPEIAQRVEVYFRNNPTFSCDAIHVAAVACQFKREKTATYKQSAV